MWQCASKAIAGSHCPRRESWPIGSLTEIDRFYPAGNRIDASFESSSVLIAQYARASTIGADDAFSPSCTSSCC